ncbi:CPBP family intramembrane glutamic endopeptidase [Pseudochryseolinea flava]|uniref:CAAX prenyl protease 2/Lysostaphin resistance protein A-like domain-containing protein n=1 Tax=Pseudochryseolinea flava TaxID=2059302 RepID=A0A364Y2W1_9BACT|nr:type II CAAX endopeptidase family protein [Pseudochryseolinea flava]RAW00652.1 hypothetical protein DQQ10_13770 [Pseudochryseolinea flava]
MTRYKIFWNSSEVGQMDNTVPDMFYIEGNWINNGTDQALAFEDLIKANQARESIIDLSKTIPLQLIDVETGSELDVLGISLHNDKIFVKRLLWDSGESSMQARPAKAYPSIGQAWGFLGIAFLFQLAGAFVSGILIAIFSVKADAALFFAYVVGTGAAFGYGHEKKSNSMRNGTYSFHGASFKMLLLIVVATVAIQLGVISPLVDLIPMPERVQDFFTGLEAGGIFSFLLVVVAAPVLEELIFRGVILDGLLKRYSPRKAIILSSALFGIIHLNPWQFVAATILGVFIGWIYFKTNNLLLCIIIHFANNLLAFITMQLMNENKHRSMVDLLDDPASASLVVIACAIVAFICLLFLQREFSANSKVEEREVRW